MTISSSSRQLVRVIVSLGRWMQKPPGLYVGIALAMFFVVILGVVIPYNQARSASRSAAKSCAAIAQILDTQSNRFLVDGSSSGLIPSKSLTVRTYLNQYENTAGVWSEIEIPHVPFVLPSLVPPIWYPGQYYQSVRSTAQEQSQINDEATSILQEARSNLLHQQKVYQALRLVLGYDATADFSNFNLSDADTLKRLELAQSGLTATVKQLEAAQSSSDPTLASLLERIRRLQTAREQLSAGTITPADWSASFSLAQADIIMNRDTYWQSISTPIADTLAAQSEKYQDVAEMWTTRLTGR